MSDGEPIAYIERTRSYYQALGYKAPYNWARFDEVPFQPPGRPIVGMRVAIVTTAAPFQPDKGDQGPGAAYDAAAKFYRVYSGTTGTMPDLPCRHRSRPHDGRGYRHMVSVGGPAARRASGADRSNGREVPRSAQQPLAARHPGA